MTNEELTQAGNFIMENKKKWTDRAFYEGDPSPREDLGYKRSEELSNRPKLPEAREVMARIGARSDRESPLKEWWLANGWCNLKKQPSE
jgi:hypothetical protein